MPSEEEVRRRIIDAAAELFAQHGYEGVGVRQVAHEAGVTQYRVRKLTGGRAALFAAVVASKVTSDAADRIALVAAASSNLPPSAAMITAGTSVFAAPERSWNLLELEGLTRSHRDAELRELESERMRRRRDNVRAVIERLAATGGVDSEVNEDALAHFAMALSAGLAMLDPVLASKPTVESWSALIARISTAIAPQEMLLTIGDGPRKYWRVLIDVPDRPGGVDRFIRAIAALHSHTLTVNVLGVADGMRTLDMRLTAPAEVTAQTLAAAARSAGNSVHISRGSPDDALDLPTRIMDTSTELIANPGWAPYAAMQLVAADHVEVVRATEGQVDGPDVLRLQWTPERHVLLRREWAPFTRVEQARASALLRLSAAIAVAAGVTDAQGWVEPVRKGTVWIRLAHPEDAEAVGAMHRRCSDRTLYLRYVSSGDWHEIQMRRLSGGHSGATLVAVGADGRVIGLGNVFPEHPEDTTNAEIAVLVEDSHHGEGIGTALLGRQLRLAERMGFTHVVAVVLAENGSMTRMLERTGLAWTTTFEGGSAIMRAPLGRPDLAGADPAQAPG